LTLLTYTLGLYPHPKSNLGISISEIVCIKIKALTETNGDEGWKSIIISLLNSTYFNINKKWKDIARSQSLSFFKESIYSYSFSMFLLFRSINTRDVYKNTTVQRLDGMKSRFRLIKTKAIGGSSINTIPKNWVSLGKNSLNQRRSYSNSFDAILRLEDKKRELERTLTPILNDNVVNFKKDSKTVWILDEENSKASTIKKGIKLYALLTTLLTSIKSSKRFTRYFEIKLEIPKILDETKVTLEPDMEKETMEIAKKIDIIELELSALGGEETIIKSDDYVPYQTSNPYSNVYRDRIKNPEEWREILHDAKGNLESILLKYWAVELTHKTNGACTPGIDEISFKRLGILFEINQVEAAREYLAKEYREYKNLISIASGDNDQSICRKGLENINDREGLRRHLKTETGQQFIAEIRKNLKTINKDPVGYANAKYESAKISNNNLKFTLCKYIKNTGLINYKSKKILRVYIPNPPKGANGKIRTLAIPSILDRSLQMLLKLVMEPYMEPLGDEYSFGLRPGRNSHQVTAYINNRLQYNKSDKTLTLKKQGYVELKMRRKLRKSDTDTDTIIEKTLPYEKMDTEKNIQIKRTGYEDKVVRRKQLIVPYWLYDRATPAKNKINYDTQYILDADIKECFDNIAHVWLIDNVPMPLGFEILLKKILKTNIYEEIPQRFSKYILNYKKQHKLIVDRTENKKGITQDNFIAPILMNWTLDGLQNHVKDSALKVGLLHNIYSLDRAALLKKRDIKENNTILSETDYRNKSRIEWDNTTWFSRYGEEFIVGVKSKVRAELLVKAISDFLEPRGLELSEEKTKIIPWKGGNKLDFLGWTHQLIDKYKVNWLKSKTKNRDGKLIDWRGTYTYPSHKATAKLREIIKLLTSNAKNYQELKDLFTKLNVVIREWSEYFSPAPRQLRLRRALDIFVWKRVRKFIMNKHQHTQHEIFIKHFTKVVSNNNNNNNTRAFWHKKTGTYRMWLDSPTCNQNLSDKGNIINSSINILNLTRLDRPSIWRVMVPNIELTCSSLFVKPTEYVRRALLIEKIRGETQSKLILKKKQIGPICTPKGELINWDSLRSDKSQDIMEFMEVLIAKNQPNFVSSIKIGNYNYNTISHMESRV
jgi:retron-type reverse transcriptase